MQTKRKGQYNTEFTLSPHLCVKPLITAITAIALSSDPLLAFLVLSQLRCAYTVHICIDLIS